MTELTNLQAGMLTTIIGCIEKNGYAPTKAELRALVGVASIRAISHRLDALENKGFIRVEAWTARGIKILRNPAGNPVKLKFEVTA